jgi:hypothetical protein
MFRPCSPALCLSLNDAPQSESAQGTIVCRNFFGCSLFLRIYLKNVLSLRIFEWDDFLVSEHTWLIYLWYLLELASPHQLAPALTIQLSLC